MAQTPAQPTGQPVTVTGTLLTQQGPRPIVNVRPNITVQPAPVTVQAAPAPVVTVQRSVPTRFDGIWWIVLLGAIALAVIAAALVAAVRRMPFIAQVTVREREHTCPPSTVTREVVHHHHHHGDRRNRGPFVSVVHSANAKVEVNLHSFNGTGSRKSADTHNDTWVDRRTAAKEPPQAKAATA